MASNGNLNFTNVNKVTFEGVGSAPNAVIDTTTGKIGVGVDDPGANLHVVGNCFVSTNLELGGTLIMGTVNVAARHNLSAITATGNSTPHTVEFTNPTTGLVTTGNVSVGGELTVGGDVNLLHTSNTASLKLNSNVVTEFPRSKKLIKYPRVALTQNALNNGYTTSASSEGDGISSGQAYRLFDGVAGGERGYHSSVVYTSGSYTGSASITDANGTPHQGEWIKLQMPTTEKMKLSGYAFSPRSPSSYWERIPYKGVFLGSTDGSTWTPIHYFDQVTTSDLVTVSRTFENTTNDYYNHIALVAYELAPGSAGIVLNFAEMELFGIPEYDPEAHGVDVVVKSVPNVPNTDWLEVYYDAKNYTSGTTVQDESTPQRNGTITTGVTSETVDGIKSFKFAGANNNNIISTAMSLPSGSGVGLHSVAVWFKRTVTYTTGLLFTIGDGGADTAPHIYISSSQGMVVDWWSNSLNVLNKLFLTDRWYHLVYTYSGGSHAQGTSIFIDGEPQALGPASNGGSILNLDGSDVLTIGSYPSGSYPFTGNMANFRLFNRPLSSDEIYQLYAYQKEYFGHGVLGMTLKAGRLGIGTSEPRAALDVRGDIIGGMPVFFDVRFTSAPTATHAGSRIVFDTINNSRGGGFDTSTGTFKAPIAGQYKFSYFMRGNVANQSFKIKPQINGSPTFATTSDGTDENILGTAFCGGDGISGSAVCIVSLEVGGTFSLFVSTHGTTITSSLSGFYNGFTGEYISSL